MRIALCLILRHGEFVHFVVVTVASDANVSSVNLFEHGGLSWIMARSTRQMIFFNVSICQKLLFAMRHSDTRTEEQKYAGFFHFFIAPRLEAEGADSIKERF